MPYLNPSAGLRRETAAAGLAAVPNLTDNSGGTANDTVEDVPAAYAEAPLANNFADVAAKVNTVLARLRSAGVIAT